MSNANTAGDMPLNVSKHHAVVRKAIEAFLVEDNGLFEDDFYAMASKEACAVEVPEAVFGEDDNLSVVDRLMVVYFRVVSVYRNSRKHENIHPLNINKLASDTKEAVAAILAEAKAVPTVPPVISTVPTNLVICQVLSTIRTGLHFDVLFDECVDKYLLHLEVDEDDFDQTILDAAAWCVARIHGGCDVSYQISRSHWFAVHTEVFMRLAELKALLVMCETKMFKGEYKVSNDVVQAHIYYSEVHDILRSKVVR